MVPARIVRSVRFALYTIPATKHSPGTSRAAYAPFSKGDTRLGCDFGLNLFRGHPGHRASGVDCGCWWQKGPIFLQRELPAFEPWVLTAAVGDFAEPANGVE